jgi:DNA polymerase-3 subunit delta'
MSFGAVRDQDVALRLLKNVLARGRVPNAMLFWGPGGVGKRMTALEMTKAVNCAEAAADACDACLSCRKVVSGNHPDVRVVTPSKKSRLIDLETLTEVTELATLRPFEGAWRVFILEDADRLSLPAQNRFLKTLEEPPGNSLFLLTTEHPRMLLPTIRSRCQLVRFRSLRPETVAELLQHGRDLSDAQAAALAALAQGQMTRALDLVDSERRTIALTLARRLASGDDPVVLAEEFVKTLNDQQKVIESTVDAELDPAEGDALTPEEREERKQARMAAVSARYQRELLEYLYLLETWYRDVLVLDRTGDPAALLNHDEAQALSAVSPARAAEKIGAIEQARVYLERFISEDRIFRDLFLTLAAH